MACLRLALSWRLLFLLQSLLLVCMLLLHLLRLLLMLLLYLTGARFIRPLA